MYDVKLLLVVYTAINRRSQRSTDFIFNVEHFNKYAFIFIFQSNASLPHVFQVLLLKLVNFLDFGALIYLFYNIFLVSVQVRQYLGNVSVIHMSVNLLQLLVYVSETELLVRCWVRQKRSRLWRSHLIPWVSSVLRLRAWRKHLRWIWIYVPHLI